MTDFANGWNQVLTPASPTPTPTGTPTPPANTPQSSIFGNGWSDVLGGPRTPQGEGLNRNLFDVTIGAAAYGGSHAISSVSKLLNRTFTPEEANGLSSYMEEFQRDHPEYAPAKIDSAWDLLTNPGALSSRVFSGLPMMGATAGLLATGPVGWGAAFGINYATGAQDAYERAMADGATPDQAGRTSMMQGLVYGTLGVMKVEKLIGWAPGAFRAIAGPALKEASAAVDALGLPASAFAADTFAPAVKSAVIAGVIGAVQSYADQLIPKGVFGRPFDADWAQQMLESGIVGGVAGVATHAGLGALGVGRSDISKSSEAPTVQLDSYSRTSLGQRLRNEFNYTEEQANDFLTGVTDRRANVWGRINNRDPNEWYATHIADDNADLSNPDLVLMQDTSKVIGFYSKLNEVVQGMAQEKWRASELKSWLQKQAGVKPDEMEWTGLNDLLSGDDKIHKQKVMDFLRDNQVRLAETIYDPDIAKEWKATHDQLSADYAQKSDLVEELQAQLQKAMKDSETPEGQQQIASLQDQLKDAGKAADDAHDALTEHREFKGLGDSTKPKYEKYTLPGPREDYREVLMRLPNYEPAEQRAAVDENGQPITLHLPEQEVDLAPEGSHFNEKNILAHLRLSTRRLPDGSKTLVVEEIQSDWHQKGRDVGYKREMTDQERTEYQSLQKEIDEREQKITELNDAMRQGTKTGEMSTEDLLKHHQNAVALDTLNQKVMPRLTELTKLDKNLGVNPAPFEKSWQELGIRRALMHAVETGHDSIAITTGQQQIDRYPGMDPKNIKGMIEAYDKILRNKFVKEVQKLDPSAKLEWQELPGEKATDAIVRMTNNGQFEIVDGTGTRVSEDTYSTRDEAQASVDRIKNEALPQAVPTIHLTDTIRDKVADGLPLFQRDASWRDLVKAQRVAVAVLKDGRVFAMEGDHGDYLKQKTFAPEDVAHFVTGKVMRDGTLVTVDDAEGGTAKLVHNIDTAAEGPYRAKDYKVGDYKVVTNDSSYYGKDSEEFFQSAKGSVTFLKDGRAFLRGLQDPNFSTGVHEMFHIFRRDLDGADHDQAAEWSGAKKNADGTWTWDRKAEEKFARAGERYLLEGKAPSTGLQAVFEKFKEWMKAIYPMIRGTELQGVKLNPKIREVFDRLFIEDTPEVSRARDHLDLVMTEYEKAKKLAANPDVMDPNKLAQLGQNVKDAQDELVRTQQSQLIPESPTEARNRITDTLQRALSMDTPKRTEGRFSLSRTMEPIRRLLTNRTVDLERTPAGKETLNRLSNATAFEKLVVGEHMSDMIKAHDGLTRADQDWLAQVDEDGVSNAQKLLNKAGVKEAIADPPSKSLQRYYDVARSLFDRISAESEKAGVLRQVKGALIPAQGQETIRSPRVFTQNGYDAIARGAGPLYDAIIEGIKKLNPELDTVELHKRLQRLYGPSVTRQVGSVEESRTIKYMPDVVQVNGKPTDILQNDPWRSLVNMIAPGARRIGFIREFGQGLKSVDSIDKLAKIAGVYEKMDKGQLAEALIQVGVDRDKVMKDIGARADLIQSPSSEVPYSLSALAKLAKQAGVQWKPSREDLVSKINNLTVADFPNKKDQTLFRNEAKKYGGIDTKADFAQVLSEVKRRISEPDQDILNQLRNSFVKQGGSDRTFVDIVRLAQGLPVGWQPEGGGWRMWKSYQNIIGAFQTALSVAPTIPQTLVQVPHATGWRNYVKALADVFQDKTFSRAQGVALGAIPEMLFKQVTERGFALDNFGKKVREALGTPLKIMDDFNNTVAARAYQRLADQWRLHGIDRVDELMAKKTLHLSEDEISQIRSNQMSDLTYAKIVQNGVSGTQYHSEPMYRRGVIESSALGRALFAYSNYTAGTLRSTLDFGSNLIDVVKNGSAKDKAIMGGKLVTYLAGAVGAGFASQLLRQMFKGNFAQQPEREDWEHRVLGALAETALLGPAQRMMEPLDPLNTSGFDRVFMGMMPQVETIAGVLNQLIGRGKFGKFSVLGGQSRILEADLPIVKAIHNWIDDFAYPDHYMYQDASVERERFERNILKKPATPPSETPINPDAYKVYEHLKRYDQEGTVQAAKEYYQAELHKIMEDPVKATLLGRTPASLAQELRQNLMAKAPLSMNPLETAMLLRDLPMSQRREMLSAQLRYQALATAVAPG